MKTKTYRKTTKKAKKFSHKFLRGDHVWQVLMKREVETVTIIETPFGKQTTKARKRRCLICGKEELYELKHDPDENARYSKVSPRKWIMKPTGDDTNNELLGVPP